MKFPEHIIVLCLSIIDAEDWSAAPALHDALVELQLPLNAKRFDMTNSMEESAKLTAEVILGMKKTCEGCLPCMEIRDFIAR